jgi:tetratricopeptide (TPR) repeat protein
MNSSCHTIRSFLRVRKTSFLSAIYLLLIFQGLMFCTFSFAQHPDEKRINILYQELPSLKGNSRVDCLNSLSEEYWWSPRPNPDSIYTYASMAHAESIQNNYSAGLAHSTLNLGVSENYRRNYPLAENYLRRSIILSENIHDDRLKAWAYIYLGWVLFLKNEYSDAEDSYLKATTFFQNKGEDEGRSKLCSFKGILYTAMGDYEKGFEYCRLSLHIRESMNDHICILLSYRTLGNLYKAAGDFETALDYYHQSLQYAKEHDIFWDENEQIGSVYCKLNRFDSSFYYLKQSLHSYPKDPIIWKSLSETYLAHNEFDSALKISLILINSFRNSNDRFHLMSSLLNAGKAYDGKKKDSSALKFTLESVSLAQQAGAKQSMIDGYHLLSKIYNHFGKLDSAFIYLSKYSVLKDSMLTKKFFSRLNDYKSSAENEGKLTRMALLDKDNKIKEQQIEQKSLLNTILIGSILIFTILSLIIFRNIYYKRKNEKLQNKNAQTELQQQVLRAQMNPHFIFNSLNSINRFILQNNKSQASEYLTKFSRLVRLILQNSQASLIPLENEIESLNLYLELEALRFDYHFEYTICIDDNLQTGNLQVPPLFIQPFVENAIWHGLMHKEEKGHLKIELIQRDDMLCCRVTDDGIGRKKALDIKDRSTSKYKSMGMRITEERIAVLQQKNKAETYVQVTDLVLPDGNTGGTEVFLKIPIIQN